LLFGEVAEKGGIVKIMLKDDKIVIEAEANTQRAEA